MSGSRWVHEIKWDGYRAQAHVAAGMATVYTRNGHDWTERFPTIARAMASVPVASAILDGEAVVVDRNGVSDFHSLRRELGHPNGAIVYKAFDLLWLNGEDLRPLPWSDRNERLAALIEGLPRSAADVISYVEPIYEAGATVFASVCGLGLEGIVSKRVDSPYRAGRSDDWRKIKCARSDTMVVIGFSENGRGQLDGLYVARADESGDMAYAGKVEQGFSTADVAELKKRLRPFVIRKPPVRVPKKPKAKWVEPKVLVEIAYPNLSASGRLRHPSFKGIRDDLRPL